MHVSIDEFDETVLGADYTYDPIDHSRFTWSPADDCIGQGAYGEVFRAIDTHNDNRRIALKAQKLGPPRSGLRAMQRQEALIHAAISDHSNIVTLYGAFAGADSHLFLAMELVDGTDLFDAAKSGMFKGNPENIREGFLQMISALRAMHAKGFYHRDIKPENIAVNADGCSWLLCDFGLASANPTSSWSGWGSDAYRAPECYGGEYRNAPADVWALGVALFCVVTQCTPWHEAIPEDEFFSAFLSDGPRYLLRAANITPEFCRLILRFLKIDPEERITLEEAEEELRALEMFTTDEELDIDSYLQYWLPAEPDSSTGKTPSLAASTVSSLSSTSSLDISTPSVQQQQPSSKYILTAEAHHLGDERW